MSGHPHPLCAVGRIVKAFGIRGEIVVEPMTTGPERFRSLRKVFAGPTEAKALPYTVTAVQGGGSGVRVTLEEVRDRSAAERLAGSFLFVGEEEKVRPPDGAFFVDDVVGLLVITEEGETVGTVREVLRMPAHDIYVIAADGREVMIPAVREFIRRIDLTARTMHVRLIEGMLA